MTTYSNLFDDKNDIEVVHQSGTNYVWLYYSRIQVIEKYDISTQISLGTQLLHSDDIPTMMTPGVLPRVFIAICEKYSISTSNVITLPYNPHTKEKGCANISIYNGVNGDVLKVQYDVANNRLGYNTSTPTKREQRSDELVLRELYIIYKKIPLCKTISPSTLYIKL